MEQRILPSRIYVDVKELGGKSRKAVVSILKELGFVEGEVSELIIIINRLEEHQEKQENESAEDIAEEEV